MLNWILKEWIFFFIFLGKDVVIRGKRRLGVFSGL